MLSTRQIQFLKELTERPGISGFEESITNFAVNRMKEMGYQVIGDNLGGKVAVKKSKTPNAKKLLLAAHIDEVGFIIKGFNSQGLASLEPIGGLWSQAVFGQRVKAIDSDGNEYRGVVSVLSTHGLKTRGIDPTKAIPTDKMLVDFGFCSKVEAENCLRIGHQVVFDCETIITANKKRIIGKALDNRVGTFAVLETLNALKDIELPFDLYAGFNVQEEVGLRGARTLTNLINPDFAIVTDISGAFDESNNQVMGALGAGVGIRVKDSGHITNPKHIDWQIKLFKQKGINHQFYISPGGTDAGQIHLHGAGVPTLQLPLVARGLHSSASVMDLGDIEELVKSMTIVVKNIGRIM